MARDLENTRAELAAAKLNLDKARSDQGKVNTASIASCICKVAVLEPLSASQRCLYWLAIVRCARLLSWHNRNIMAHRLTRCALSWSAMYPYSHLVCSMLFC